MVTRMQTQARYGQYLFLTAGLSILFSCNASRAQKRPSPPVAPLASLWALFTHPNKELRPLIFPDKKALVNDDTTDQRLTAIPERSYMFRVTLPFSDKKPTCDYIVGAHYNWAHFAGNNPLYIATHGWWTDTHKESYKTFEQSWCNFKDAIEPEINAAPSRHPFVSLFAQRIRAMRKRAHHDWLVHWVKDFPEGNIFDAVVKDQAVSGKFLHPGMPARKPRFWTKWFYNPAQETNTFLEVPQNTSAEQIEHELAKHDVFAQCNKKAGEPCYVYYPSER